MQTVTLEQARERLTELIEQLPGEGVIITRNAAPVAQLKPITAEGLVPQFGSCRGKLTILSEDDDHLADFRDYMP